MDSIHSAKTESNIKDVSNVEGDDEYSKNAPKDKLDENMNDENNNNNSVPQCYEYLYLDSPAHPSGQKTNLEDTENKTKKTDLLKTNKTGVVHNKNLTVETVRPSDSPLDFGHSLNDNIEDGIAVCNVDEGKDNKTATDCSDSFVANSCANTGAENNDEADILNKDICYIFDKNDLLENSENSRDLGKTHHCETDNADKNYSDKSIVQEPGDELDSSRIEYETLGNQQRICDNSGISQPETLTDTSVSYIRTNENTLNKSESDNDKKDSANCEATVHNDSSECNNEDKNKDNRQFLDLNLPSQSPESDGRGVSPEIICLTHLSPTTVYGKEQLAVPRLISNQDISSRPPSLNTPDPVVYGESDSSSCPTPLLYASSSNMPYYGNYTDTGSNNHFLESNYSYVLPEDPVTESDSHDRGHKRKMGETDINNNETSGDSFEMGRVTPGMFPFSKNSFAFVGQMYQYQGKPPDVSTWTAVSSGACKYRPGCGQNYGNNFTRDPFLFGYQQQMSDCEYNSHVNGQFSSKPTCTVPPYLLNHTQTTDSYSAYSQNSSYANPHQFSIYAGRNTLGDTFDPSERTMASCQFASNQSIDSNNNIQFSMANTCSSRTCCRLDFSSPVNEEQFPYSGNFPVPTFVSSHSYLSGLSRPEPVFLRSVPLITASGRTATCTSTYSRPSSAMSTHSDNPVETASADFTQGSSAEETLTEEEKDENTETSNEQVEDDGDNLLETSKNEVLPEAEKVPGEAQKMDWCRNNRSVPIKAGGIQLMCPLTELKGKTVAELIETAEKKLEPDFTMPNAYNCANSNHSGTAPPPAHQNVTESFAAEFIRQRRSKSPISAFCAALDLSKPKKKDRPILPHPSFHVQPAIPISSLLNIHGPTLSYNGSMMVPYLQTLCAASSYSSMSNTPLTKTDHFIGQKYIPIAPNRMANTSSAAASQSQMNISPGGFPTSGTLMNFNPFVAMSAQGLQYLPFMGAAASVSLNQQATSGNTIPNINLSSIPLPLYQQLPQDTNDPVHTLEQAPTTTQSKTEEQDKQFLYRRNIGLAVPVTIDSGASIIRREVRGRKKKSAAFSIAPPPVTVPGYTASIQGSNVTTGPEPANDAVTYFPKPARQNEASTGTCGKRAFKARHCNFSILRIGTFQYTCPTISYEKVARVKFLYSKKKLLYEFQLNDLEAASVTPHRRLTEIEVPFNTVVGLWLFDREMRLEVNTPPTMCLGSKILEKHPKHGIHAPPVYDRNQLVDLTDGQLTTVPYHYIQFKSCCAEKLKTEMGQFDNRFSLLLKTPLIEDPNKTLKLPEIPITSHLLDPVLPSGKSKRGRHRSSAGCKCETGCSSDLCCCCVRGGTCTEGECLCINCRNPLNILHQLGLPVHRARTDPCLMENIYQIKKLECYLKIPLLLECCQIPLNLLQCIPGSFTCPSIGCGIKYSYSWCAAQLCNDDVAPRNHCVKCGRCTDYRNRHCELCNICYFAGESGSFKCPVCHNGMEEESFGLHTTSSESDG